MPFETNALELTGPQTVMEVADTYARIMLLMEQDQDITINVELVEKFDAITVQLLYSAHLYAREKGSQISVAFGESQALPKILGELGCLAPGPGQACVELNKWVGISE